MNNRIWLKVLSILLGIFAWIYVNLVIPPQIRRTLTAEIEYRNQPELVSIEPAKQTVQVQMEGSRRDFILSNRGKVQVSVDLYNVRPGRAQLPVRVIAAPGLTVVSVSPPQVQIEVIPLTRKVFDVEIKTDNSPADGYIAEAPMIKPDKVTLEGPEKLIKRVTGCTVEVNLDNIKNSISENRPVKILLEPGLSSEEIKISPEEVNLDVLVKQGYPDISIDLARPVFLNSLPEGKKRESARVIPETVVVKGPPKQIKQLKYLTFKPINLSEISETATIPIKLELPENTRLVSTETPVLAIEISEIKVVRTYDGLPFELKKSEDQHTSVSVSSYSIEVEGYLSDIDKIRNARLQMILDIEKMKPGSYTVNLAAPTGLPENISVLKIKPEELHIQISKLSENPAGIATSSQPVKEPAASSTISPENPQAGNPGEP